MSDTFANPQPPSNYKHPGASRDDSGPMTNDDFRKLLMTPSVGLHGAGGFSSSSGPSASVRSQRLNFSARSNNVKDVHQKKKMDEKRKERKQFYAALVNESKEKQAELAQKYRDRAKERREKEKTGAPEEDVVSTTSTNYRAVAPGFSLNDQAERRRQLIEESKYLGGDIEHTHLVKGLDYALLQKVKSQEAYGIEVGGGGGGGEGEEGDEAATAARRKSRGGGEADDEDEDDEDNEGESEMRASGDKEATASSDPVLESAEQRIKMNLKPKIVPKTTAAALAAALNRSVTDNPFAFKKYLESKAVKSQTVASSSSGNKSRVSDEGDEVGSSEGEGETSERKKVVFKTPLGRNIYRQLFELQLPKTNELFQPNRMAYIVELNDDETDVPITSIRSKAECPNMDTGSILTTNDIVINKLTQILSYLRHGKRDAKKLKKKGSALKSEESELSKKTVVDAAHSSLGIYDDIGDYVPDLSKPKSKEESSESKKEKRRIKFDEKDIKDEPLIQAPSKEAAKDFIKNINQKYGDKELGEKPSTSKKEDGKPGFTVKFSSDSYAECYPGTNAEEDVNVDSDEEADFSKMDLGNKKGPVNRWDFDTNEEYSDYMSNREALPKAAFQYGLKMTDGRKTKRAVPGDASKTEKAKIDKEWTQISRLIDKRKNGEYSNSEMKKIKY